MTEQVPGTPAQEPPPPPPRWRAALPHVFTALLTLALALTLQPFLRPAAVQVVIPTAVVAPSASAQPRTPPTPAQLTPVTTSESGFLRQELADLRAGQQQLWSAVYLSRALNQIAEAESTLRSNDFSAVDQALIAADDSLAMAYLRADRSIQSPIETLRREIDGLRDDLFLYPERMDLRLMRLRQFILTLIEQPR
jgi:hypothetical protein